jgi:hypothetical protein
MRKKDNNMTNNCKNPLRLRWKEVEWQYKVNKPLDQSGEYVDKHIADELLNALISLKDKLPQDDATLKKVNYAIKLATQDEVSTV